MVDLTGLRLALASSAAFALRLAQFASGLAARVVGPIVLVPAAADLPEAVNRVSSGLEVVGFFGHAQGGLEVRGPGAG